MIMETSSHNDNPVNSLAPSQTITCLLDQQQSNVHIFTILNDDPTNKQNSIKKLFPCEYCLTWYTSEKDLESHVFQTHSTTSLTDKEPINEPKTQCMICLTSFASCDELEKHLNEHAEKLYQKTSTQPEIQHLDDETHLDLTLDQQNMWITSLPKSQSNNFGSISSNDAESETKSISKGAKKLAMKRNIKREELGDAEFRRRMAESQRRTRARRRERMGEEAFRQEMALKQRQTREKRRLKTMIEAMGNGVSSDGVTGVQAPIVLRKQLKVDIDEMSNVETADNMFNLSQDSATNSSTETKHRYSREARQQKRQELGEIGFREWMAEQQRRTRAKKRERLGEKLYREEMAQNQRKTRARKKWSAGKESTDESAVRLVDSGLIYISACVLSKSRQTTGIRCGNHGGQLPSEYVKLASLPLDNVLASNLPNLSHLQLQKITSERALIFNRAGIADNFTDNEVICVWHRFYYGIGFQASFQCAHPAPFHTNKSVSRNFKQEKCEEQQRSEPATRTSSEALANFISSTYSTYFPVGQTLCSECYEIEMLNLANVPTSPIAATNQTEASSVSSSSQSGSSIFVQACNSNPIFSVTSSETSQLCNSSNDLGNSLPVVSFSYISDQNGGSSLQQLTSLNQATLLTPSPGTAKSYSIPVMYIRFDDASLLGRTSGDVNIVTVSEPFVNSSDYTSNKLIPLQSQSPPSTVTISLHHDTSVASNSSNAGQYTQPD